MNTNESKNTSTIKNDDAETAVRPLTAQEVSEIEGGGIIDAAKELIRLLRTAGQPQL